MIHYVEKIMTFLGPKILEIVSDYNEESSNFEKYKLEYKTMENRKQSISDWVS